MLVKPEQLREKAGLVRAWLTTLFRADLRGGTKGGLVHYVLDEFGSLGGRLEYRLLNNDWRPSDSDLGAFGRILARMQHDHPGRAYVFRMSPLESGGAT